MAVRWPSALVCVGLAVIWSVPFCSAQSQQEYDLCARGLNKNPVKPFLQTMRIKISITGQSIEKDLLNTIQTQLILATVWKDQATEVFVEDFNATDCVASADKITEISAKITEEDLIKIREERTRGPGMIERVEQIAKVANVSIGLSSIADDAQRRWLTVFYATNRNATGNSKTSEAFSTDRAEALSYGSVEVAVLHQKNMRDIESPSIFKFEKATSLDDFAVAGSYVVLSHEQWMTELKKRANHFEKPGVLLFVHGYNTSFIDAARRTAQLAYDLAFPGPTVFLSWPSDASVINYMRDGEVAETSWLASSQVLSDLTSLLPNGPVYVVAHSMGTRVMLGGLTRLLEQSPSRRRTIKAVVMAAPDMSQAAFRMNIAYKVLNLGIPFTLYASDRDLALGASEFLQGGKRLGMGGQSLFVMNGIDSVDASAVTRDFFALNHSYFGDKTAVLSDLFHLIRLGLPPDKRPNLLKVGDGQKASWAIK